MKIYAHPSYSYVKVAEIPISEVDKIEFDICQQPAETLINYYNRQTVKPDLLTNGGFFAMSTGTTVFNYINNKKVISSDPQYKWGMGVIGASQLKYGEISQYDWKDFISGYPVLIDNGVPVTITFASELNYNARRTMIGYNDTTIFIVSVEAPGLAYKAMQNLMFWIGCKYAINLDGGGSTKMLHKGVSVTIDATNRPVDNVLAVYLKSQPIVYRVQLGAFASKINADNFLKSIKVLSSKIGMDYTKAQIVIINDIYKVQVGAFTNKDNANKVITELKQLGFNAFITV